MSDDLKETLEVARRVSSLASMLDLYSDMLCIEENCTKDQLQLAVVYKSAAGAGRVGPSWKLDEFHTDLLKLQALLNRMEGSCLTPWEDILKAAGEDAKDTALDTIFNEFDDALAAGKFEDVDAYLDTIPMAPSALTLWIGVLSISRGSKGNLKKRSTFYDKVLAEVKAMGRDPVGLLGGLE